MSQNDSNSQYMLSSQIVFFSGLLLTSSSSVLACLGQPFPARTQEHETADLALEAVITSQDASISTGDYHEGSHGMCMRLVGF